MKDIKITYLRPLRDAIVDLLNLQFELDHTIHKHQRSRMLRDLQIRVEFSQESLAKAIDILLYPDKYRTTKKEN